MLLLHTLSLLALPPARRTPLFFRSTSEPASLPPCLPQVVGCYVGFATVGAFATWFTSTSFLGIDLSQDGHTPVSFAQLRDWEACHTWEGFQVGRAGSGQCRRAELLNFWVSGPPRALPCCLSTS